MRIFHRFFLFILLLSAVGALQAHQIRPAIIHISFQPEQTVLLRIETNVEALLAGIGPQHADTDDAPQAQVYRELRQLAPEELVQRFNAFKDDYARGLQLLVAGQPVTWSFLRISVPEVGDTRLSRQSLIEYRSRLPAGATQVVWSYAADYGDAVVNFLNNNDNSKTTYWLVKGQSSPPFVLQGPAQQRPWFEVMVDYLELGFIHILPMGLDHILFVLGLFLLSRHLGPLLWQVTAFTVAHSITLALSIYGVIEMSPTVVEPLIALSIAYVGLENLFTRTLHSWRVLLVFVFGLLHGMGFAGVLLELGLPASEFVSALVAFNLGVEFGQLSVIALAFAAVFWLRDRDPYYRNLVVIPGSLVIAVMGLYWTWERIG